MLMFVKEKSICHKTCYNGRIVEAAVFAILQAIANSPKLIEAAVEAFMGSASGHGDANTQENLLRELSALQEREKATVKAQISRIQAGADPGVYEGVFADIAATRKRLQEKLAAVEVSEPVQSFDPKRAEIYAVVRPQ